LHFCQKWTKRSATDPFGEGEEVKEQTTRNPSSSDREAKGFGEPYFKSLPNLRTQPRKRLKKGF
jgi:hypothetical protein